MAPKAESEVFRILSCKRGNVAIEFGFMVPVFIMMVVAGVELTRLGVEWSRITHAASAGALYGMRDQTTASDSAGMEQAAREDAGDTANLLSVNASNFCQCLGTTEKLDCATAANCADGKYPPMFVEVTVEQSLDAILPYLSLPDEYALASTNTSRVR